MKSFFKNIFTSCLGVILAFAVLFLIFFLIAGIVGSKLGDSTPEVKSNSVLMINMKQSMPDKTNNMAMDMFSFDSKSIVGLNDAVRLIHHAKTDDNIKGIYLNLSEANPVGGSTLKSLRDALDSFKTTGKFIYAYGENLNQGSYYLSSISDKIYLNPVGDITFKGFGISMMYYKNLLDELQIKPNVFYVGKFKSATEPFRNEKMSNENRIQLKTFLNDMFSRLVQDISDSRKIDPNEVKKIADQMLIQSPEDALKFRFIDKIAYEDEVLDEIKTILKLKPKDKINFTTLEDYYDATTLSKNYSAKDKIAIIYAEGEINDSNEKEGQVGGKAYVQMLRKARYDDQVKAIVLRVNSPGGSAYASEQIAHEIDQIRLAGKKVIVSMGDYAASGGYYIACGADSIFATPNTITGSIGIFGIIPDISGFLKNKLKITMDSVKTGPNALGITNQFDLSADQKNMIQKYIERGYDTFISRVAKGRNISKSQVDSIAQGRIYSGTDAKKLGLVDKIGDLDAAIASAVTLAKLKDYRIVEYPESKPPLQKILDQIQGISDDKVKMAVDAEISKIVPEYLELRKILNNNPIQARLPYIIKY